MAALGTVIFVDPPALLQPTGYTISSSYSASKGTVQFINIVPLTLFPTGFSIAGTLPCPECEECPDPPAGFPDEGIIWPPGWLNPG